MSPIQPAPLHFTAFARSPSPSPPRHRPQAAQRVIPRDISMGIMAMEAARRANNIKVRRRPPAARRPPPAARLCCAFAQGARKWLSRTPFLGARAPPKSPLSWDDGRLHRPWPWRCQAAPPCHVAQPPAKAPPGRCPRRAGRVRLPGRPAGGAGAAVDRGGGGLRQPGLPGGWLHAVRAAAAAPLGAQYEK